MSSEGNLFKDYCKADDSDDEENNSDLQDRLYAEIYYQSNIEGESEIHDVLRESQYNCLTNVSMNDQDIQHEFKDKESSKFQTTDNVKLMIAILGEHCGQNTLLSSNNFAESLIQNNIIQSFDSNVSVDIQESCLTQQIKPAVETSVVNSRDNLTNPEMTNITGLSSCNNPLVCEYDNVNNNISSDSTIAGRKKDKESCTKKHKSSKRLKSKNQIYDLDTDTKYNVLQKKEKQDIAEKQKQEALQVSSDSEESILEMPIPRKPSPPLIDLQDSDEEDTGNSAMKQDDCFVNRQFDRKNIDLRVLLNSKSRNSEVIDEDIIVIQNLSSKSKITEKFPHGKNTQLKHNKNVNSTLHEVNKDIVLNCIAVQKKGIRNINQIQQLSKSAQVQEEMLTENISKNSKKQSPQSITRNNTKNNAHIFQETHATSVEKKSQVTNMQQNVNTNCINTESNITCNVAHNVRHTDQDLRDDILVEVSCDDSNLVMSRKKHRDDDNRMVTTGSPLRKRQCTIQSSKQKITQTPQNSDGGTTEIRNESFWNEYFFKPMPDKLRRFYSDSRGQENFDVRELQRRMSKDPKKWAILDVDLMPCPASKRATRYRNGSKCSHCHREGHVRKDCPESSRLPCCHMCGIQGHTEYRCPQKICLTCGKKQSSFRKTCDYCRTLYCTMCNSVGHKAQQCPDLWRRYHQTTIETGYTLMNPGNVMKPASQLYCCNCTKRGHEVSTCKEYRWSLHFVTPAVVTNYTDGPKYTVLPLENAPNISVEVSVPRMVGISSHLVAKNNKTPQKLRNTPEMQMHSESSPNIDTSVAPLNIFISANQIPSSQRISCNSTTEEDSVCSSNVDKSLLTIEKQAKQITSAVRRLDFVTVMYSFGTFCDKDHEDVQIEIHNLSHSYKLSRRGNQYVECDLMEGKVIPVFLTQLQEKVEFEITIGKQSNVPDAIMLQLISFEKCIQPLSDLLFYWFNLPFDEKNYGIDVDLPTNPREMFHYLNSKISHLREKITTWGIDSGAPKMLFHNVQEMKAMLATRVFNNKDYGSKYSRRYNRVLSYQLELLMIVNTEPKPSIHVTALKKYLNMLQNKSHIDVLDPAIFLEIVLNYNHVFVPHTPFDIIHMLKCAVRHRKQLKQLKQKAKSFASKINIRPSADTCTSQNIKPTKNSFIITDIQNVSHNQLAEVKRPNNISLEIAGVSENSTQHSQHFSSLDPKPIQSEKLEKSKDNKAIESNINAESTCNQKPLSKKAKKKLKKAMKMQNNTNECSLKNNAKLGKKKAKLINSVDPNLYNRAKLTVEEARFYKIPYIMKAADDLQKKINNQILEKKHINALQNLIRLEKKHQRKVNQCYSYLK